MKTMPKSFKRYQFKVRRDVESLGCSRKLAQNLVSMHWQAVRARFRAREAPLSTALAITGPAYALCFRGVPVLFDDPRKIEVE